MAEKEVEADVLLFFISVFLAKCQGVSINTLEYEQSCVSKTAQESNKALIMRLAEEHCFTDCTGTPSSDLFSKASNFSPLILAMFTFWRKKEESGLEPQQSNSCNCIAFLFQVNGANKNKQTFDKPAWMLFHTMDYAILCIL